MNDIITKINDNFEVLKSRLISTVPKMDILKPREWDKIKKHLKDRLSKLDKGEIITSSIFIDYVK